MMPMTTLAVPSGKPTITAAHNTSSESIQLIWRPPPKSSINGEFLGYQIAYRPRNDNSSSGISQTQLKDPEISQFTIVDLQPFTQYLVSLRVINPAGLGPETKVVVMTDEGGKNLKEVSRGRRPASFLILSASSSPLTKVNKA